MKLELKICGTPAASRGSLESRQTRGCTGRLPRSALGLGPLAALAGNITVVLSG